MIINANTRIASILKHNAAALEAIISINPKFEKLKNPVLRKLLAGRASIAMAAKIGGCSVTDFFDKLRPFGFEIDADTLPEKKERNALPAFLQDLQPQQITELDVRPILASGQDPLSLIVQRTREIKPGEVLKIINTFEPVPLMLLLGKQGFESFADMIADDYVETYFHKTKEAATANRPDHAEAREDWEHILERFQSKIQAIDVRQLEMPLPMMTILEALDKLPADTALYVYHKRIPVYLLPELADRKFSYRIKEIGEGEVHLVIFKD